ncbi:MAG: hypothetical protein L0L39_01215 [Atopostipes suicloacalis]|uniref:Uncharacterized protein n=1 Tax=Tetragenococcus koreensis TaxID=290335 RepID=A0AAN4RKM8_9ENTE|nr:hypothetical protein [Tetragenococcus koreensis]MDN6730778.1 hypothetical protein [Atopostipes suicloacalis]MDN6347613.1 hypothetical protein [Tetragenococcus koreensis]GEQ51736.1 hypothetical protein TK12N_10800 [Tetragenococcus koreensis]GEQ54321.1 hypothetical protein TK2N_11650 [Tetragenococcus koreensis]
MDIVIVLKDFKNAISDIIEGVENIDFNYSCSIFKECSRKEFRTVLKYVAEESNRKQRKIAGLDK